MTTLRCNGGCGKRYGVNETKMQSDARYNYYVHRIMQRFNVTSIAELVSVYKCRSCRTGKSRRQVVTPQQLPQIQLVQPSMVKKLKLIGQGKDINPERYNNFYVGFEFEFEQIGNISRIREICNKYGLSNGKTNGIARITQQIRLAEGGSIPVPVQDDLYKRENVVTQVYLDGSVGVEVVTRPLHFKNLEKAKEVFEYCKSKGNLKSPKAGLHMTFLLDWHKGISDFDHLVVKNLIQMVRMYYEPIIRLFKQSNRGTSYRIINTYASMQNPIAGASHHFAISVRAEAQKIWGIEIRLPDGTDDWEVVKKQVLFYSALIRHCVSLSKKGLLFLEQEQYNKQQDFYERSIQRTNEDMSQETLEAQIDLMSRIANDVEALTIKEVSIDDMYEQEEANMERLRMAQMHNQR